MSRRGRGKEEVVADEHSEDDLSNNEAYDDEDDDDLDDDDESSSFEADLLALTGEKPETLIASKVRESYCFSMHTSFC